MGKGGEKWVWREGRGLLTPKIAELSIPNDPGSPSFEKVTFPSLSLYYYNANFFAAQRLGE